MSSDRNEAESLDVMGPIDYLIVEFPGRRTTGAGLPILVDLVDRGIIRILDLALIRKELDGSVVRLNLADLEQEEKADLAVFEGASSGLLEIRTTSTRPRRSSRRAARPACSSTRTAGRPRSRWRCGAAAGSWWPAGASRCRRCSRRSTPPRRPSPRPRRDRAPSTEHRAPRNKEQQQMPGLIRGVARTAVVAGTATAVSNRVSRRQAGRWAEQDQQAAYQQQRRPRPRSSTPRPRSSTPPRRSPRCRSTPRRRPCNPPPAPGAGRRPRGRRHEREARAAAAARRAEDPGPPHRRRVRGAEAQDPRRLTRGHADPVAPRTHHVPQRCAAEPLRRPEGA